ncbi:hypothetical protein [Nostoc sp. CENA543]|nr:hypothetical protein [Nostoc sp. CENA543]
MDDRGNYSANQFWILDFAESSVGGFPAVGNFSRRILDWDAT